MDRNFSTLLLNSNRSYTREHTSVSTSGIILHTQRASMLINLVSVGLIPRFGFAGMEVGS